jgi:hypothetical protein
MENQNLSTKTMLKFGVILGIATIILSLLNYSFGNIYKQHWSIGVLSLLITVAIIVFGLKNFKDQNNGFLTLGQAIKTGVGITLISIVIGLIYHIVFVKVLEPDFYTNMIQSYEQNMLKNYPDMPEEQVEMAVEMTKKFSNLGMTIAMMFGIGLLFGLIISLIVGAIMKKEEDQF